MKTYIVTGGAGFIGSCLARRLLSGGNKVYIIDDLSTGFRRNVPAGAVFFKADICDPDKLLKLKLPKQVDTIYHLAAQSSGEASFDDPARDMEINYKATYNVLRLALAKKAKRFIYSSSMSVYGEVRDNRAITEEYKCDPVSYYGANKLASEKLIKIFTRNTDIAPTIFRLFSVYGPGQNMLNMKQGIVSIYLSYIMNDRPITVKGSLDRFRDLVYVEDVVDALTACEGAKECYGKTFNLGTGVKTTVKELVGDIVKSYSKKSFNEWVKVAGKTAGDTRGCVADISKIKKALGWRPKYDIAEGVRRMKVWLDQTKDLWKSGARS